MSEQYDSLNEKAKLVDISMKYTGGDMEKAKAMAGGQFNDIAVIKGKFYIPATGHSGLFFSFFNIVEDYISHVDAVISSNKTIYDKSRVFDDWKTLFADANKHKENVDMIDSGSFIEFLLDALIENDVFLEIEDNNLDELTRKTNDIIATLFNQSTAQCQIDLDQTSSLAMELAGINIEIPGDTNEAEEPENQEFNQSIEDERITKVENEANYVVNGSIIVSPVSGKYINDIDIGDTIMVLLTGNDPVSSKLLNVLKAQDDEGNIKPVKGRIRAKIPLDKSGYIIYALVAKGILAKIVEEENVKIRTEETSKKMKDQEPGEEKESKFLYIIAVLVGLVLLSGILLIQLL